MFSIRTEKLFSIWIFKKFTIYEKRITNVPGKAKITILEGHINFKHCCQISEIFTLNILEVFCKHIEDISNFNFK